MRDWEDKLSWANVNYLLLGGNVNGLEDIWIECDYEYCNKFNKIPPDAENVFTDTLWVTKRQVYSFGGLDGE